MTLALSPGDRMVLTVLRYMSPAGWAARAGSPACSTNSFRHQMRFSWPKRSNVSLTRMVTARTSTWRVCAFWSSASVWMPSVICTKRNWPQCAPPPLQIRPYPCRERSPEKPEAARTAAVSTDFARWFASNVTPQKQPGFFMVHIPLALGDLPAAKTAALADIVAAHGDGILCATQSQNVVLRWVAESELPRLREKLDASGLATPEPPGLRNLVACAGASTCRLGICLSRGLAKAIRRELTGSQLKLESMGDLAIHISGCPNSCGRHPVGNIGFSGAARRVDGQLIPYYAVQLGGRVTEGHTRFGTNRSEEHTSE